jgi:hypothetical protein
MTSINIFHGSQGSKAVKAIKVIKMIYIIAIHRSDLLEVMEGLSGKLSDRVSIRKWGDEPNCKLYISSLWNEDSLMSKKMSLSFFNCLFSLAPVERHSIILELI